MPRLTKAEFSQHLKALLKAGHPPKEALEILYAVDLRGQRKPTVAQTSPQSAAPVQK